MVCQDPGMHSNLFCIIFGLDFLLYLEFYIIHYMEVYTLEMYMYITGVVGILGQCNGKI